MSRKRKPVKEGSFTIDTTYSGLVQARVSGQGGFTVEQIDAFLNAAEAAGAKSTSEVNVYSYGGVYVTESYCNLSVSVPAGPAGGKN